MSSEKGIDKIEASSETYYFVCFQDFNYTLTGLYYNVDDFPTYMPEAEFKITIIMLKTNRIGVRALFWGRVVYIKNDKAQ